jgi:hypothetical protein
VDFLRCGDDNFSINKLFVEGRVLTLLVRCGDESVTLVLKPFADTKLVLGGTEKAGDLSGVLTTLAAVSIKALFMRGIA